MPTDSILVDANIVVYLLLKSDKTEMARQLFEQSSRWVSESFMPIELTSAFITAVRIKENTEKQAAFYMEHAHELFPSINLLKANHYRAMEMAMKYKVSAYDARYLVIARELDTRLVTNDKPLRKAAPELTMSLDEALAL